MHSPSHNRRSMSERIAAGALVCCAVFASSPALPSGAFKRLNAAEIKAHITGKVVTDKVHWSDRYEPDGTLKAVDLGVLKPGTWKLDGNEMCVVRKAKKAVTECFEIWLSGNEVEYRRDGITLTTGFISNE
jgi:hypothetical protein